MRLKGDIDGDGKITVMDALIIAMYMSGALTLTDDELNCADVDGNGAVEIMDMLHIAKHISGKELIDEVIW